MKTLGMLFTFLFFITTAFSQGIVDDAEKLKKPVDCGVGQYDAFKNSSFDLKDDLLKSTKNHAQLSEDIAKYDTGEREKNAINLGGDMAKMRQPKNSMGDFDERVNRLAGDGKTLAENVTSVRPVTKVKQATDNTKTSMRAVDLSRDLLKELKTNVDKDLEKLEKYMKEVEKE